MGPEAAGECEKEWGAVRGPVLMRALGVSDALLAPAVGEVN